MSLTPGDTLFEYRITRSLGQGAFGTVYLAQDTLLDRPVAIKELNASAQADTVAFQRFLQEARVAGSLNHPNIVTIYALKPVQNSMYMVMEYLSGNSLRTLLSQCGRLSVDNAVRIAADVCEGLSAAHTKGIVHRDIKPENILLTAEGRAKVGDFGIAHVPRVVGGANMTATGFQPGTLVYMSPEQIRGEAVDSRSDVYQVGTLLYEMLTGRCCIDIETLTRCAQETSGGNMLRMQARLYDLLEEAICEHEPPDLCGIRPDIPEWLGEIVAATLSRQITSRPMVERLGADLRSGNRYRLPDQAADRSQSEKDTLQDRFRSGQTRRPLNSEPGPAAISQKTNHVDPVSALEATTAHRASGIAAWLEGDADEASRELPIAWKGAEAAVEVHLNLGFTYGREERLDEAARELLAVLRIDPNHVDALYNLGVIYGQQGRTDEAIREYQAALRLDPNYANPHCNLGVALLEQGRIDEAIREFQAALRIDPDWPLAHFNLGGAYWKKGNVDKACNEFRTALRIDPDYPEAHYKLGVIYARLGRLREARQEAKRALELGLEPARQLLAMLK